MPLTKDQRLLRLGIVGCGPVSQIAHFDAVRKARNVELHAICDVASDLRERMFLVHRPRVAFERFEDMLADSRVEAVLIAVADQFHVPLARLAVAAGKHVLVEKPLGVAVEECEVLRREVASSKVVFQIGNNRRFDPGVAFARRFVREEIGGLLSLKAWYWDSVHRYTMTDNLQPVPERSAASWRPTGDPKSERGRYFLLTHGSHLVDTARWFGGPIVRVRARRRDRFDAFCWFVDVEFDGGALGHLDLTVPIRGDFEEGFQVQGEGGSVKGRVHLPWFHKAADVDCFSERDRCFHRPLGEDAFSYKRQVEAFAHAILNGGESPAAGIDDGVAAVRALAAIARSAESGDWVALSTVSGTV